LCTKAGKNVLGVESKLKMMRTIVQNVDGFFIIKGVQGAENICQIMLRYALIVGGILLGKGNWRR